MMTRDDTAPALTVWHRLDRFLALLRPHREPLSLLIDGLVIAGCWNVTYLFRLGFERWLSARPGYDAWVMLGVIVVYLAAFAALRVPQSMWRFSGFGDIKRLTLACAAAGLASAALVMALGLTKVPRALLALHPFVTLMGVCVVRIAYRMVYEHARRRSPAATPRSAARWCSARATPPSCCCPASMTRAGRCSACSTTTLPSRAHASPACRCWARWPRCRTRPCAARPRTW